MIGRLLTVSFSLLSCRVRFSIWRTVVHCHTLILERFVPKGEFRIILTDLVPVPRVERVDHRWRGGPHRPVDGVVQLRHLADRAHAKVVQNVLEEGLLGILKLRIKRRVLLR